VTTPGLDISEVHDITRAAEAAFDEMPAEILRIVADAAALERRTHEWRNITGLLEQNTRAQVASRDQDPYEVQLVMNRQYASNVRDRQRTDIDKRRDEAAREIEFYQEGQVLKLSRM
jgi:hypothetical protein